MVGSCWMLGSELSEVARLFKAFYDTAINAGNNPAKYREAGRYLAQAVSKVGVDVVLGILLHKASVPLQRKLVNMRQSVGVERPVSAVEEPVSKEKAPVKRPAVVSRLPKYRTRPPFEKNPNHSQAEFERQIQGQQDGLNNMTVDEYLQNSDRYKAKGRSGSKAQQADRKKAINEKAEELESQGLSYEDAIEEAADNWADTPNALHNPDQIAGGHPDKIEGMGDAGVNKSIGSQWEKQGRAKNMDDYIREQAKTMTPEERKPTKLNIELDH